MRRFRNDRSGVSAVEFALVLPFLLILYLGGTQISQALSADRRVTLLARTLSDLVAQNTTITKADVDKIFDAATAVAYPLPGDDLKMVIASVYTDKDKVSKVDWSRARNADAYSHNQTITTLNPQPNTWTILAKVSYTFHPEVGYGIVGDIPLSASLQMLPRTTIAQISCTDC